MKIPSKHSDTKLQWDGANSLKPNNVTLNTAMQFPLPFLPVRIKIYFPVFKSLQVLPLAQHLNCGKTLTESII